FSALEVWQGAATLGLPLERYLAEVRDGGLASLPGTAAGGRGEGGRGRLRQRYMAELRDVGLASLPGPAAEVLDDEVRRIICPDKVTTAQWLHVHDTAHRVGLRSTTTIMYRDVDIGTA